VSSVDDRMSAVHVRLTFVILGLCRRVRRSQRMNQRSSFAKIERGHARCTDARKPSNPGDDRG
jgi:hypothetical protein